MTFTPQEMHEHDEAAARRVRNAEFRKAHPEYLQEQCDVFNAANPVGTRVLLKKDFVAEPFETKTRSLAQVLSEHSAVIWLEGVIGCYALDCVTPISTENAA